MQQLWLYLHFPRLHLNSLYLGNQAPVVVVDSQRHDILQVNPEADRFGIEVGMGLATAALLCGTLQVHPYQQSSEINRLKSLARELYNYTSDICLYPPNGLLLRVSPMLSLYQGLDRYWQCISHFISEQNLDYQFATGHSPLSARLLAKQGWNQVSENKQTHLQILSNYPISCGDISTRQQQQLSRLGIQRFEQLFSLPLAQIAQRFDIELVNYIGRLKGELQHPHEFYLPPARFYEYIELLYEIHNQQRLIPPLQKLFSQLQTFLYQRNKVCHQVDITLIQRDKQALSIALHSAQGEYQAANWLSLAELKLERLELAAPVIAMSIASDKLFASNLSSQDLFEGEQGTMSPLQLLSLLQARLGQGAISSPAVANDFRPEKACIYDMPLQHHHLPEKLQSMRPLLLLPHPKPLRDKVNILYGPERLNSGWWDDDPILRDYFIAVDKQGRWCWIFRQANQQWYLHGFFS